METTGFTVGQLLKLSEKGRKNWYRCYDSNDIFLFLEQEDAPVNGVFPDMVNVYVVTKSTFQKGFYLPELEPYEET
jgi:hypothetical protein